MTRILLATLALLLALPATADTLPPLALKDQWDRAQALDENTALVIYSREMDGSKWVRSVLEELQVGDLPARHWLYVANISTMPSMVSRMIAIPKMRDYAYPVALVRDEAVLQGWPPGEGALTVYELRQREIVKAHQIGGADELRTLLRQKIGSPPAAGALPPAPGNDTP